MKGIYRTLIILSTVLLLAGCRSKTVDLDEDRADDFELALHMYE